MKTAQIALDEISRDDRTFELPGFRDGAGLRESLDRFGVMDPPWVLRRGGGYAIVDGFKRLSWARGRGVSDITCRLLPEKITALEAWERRIGKKLFEGGLNPAEKAALAAVLPRIAPREKIPEFFLAALNISNRGSLLEKWAKLCSFGTNLLEALGSGEINERAALEFSGWEPESARSVVALLRPLRCSASIQVEIVERIGEIAVREQTSRLDVLSRPEIQNITSDKDLNHRQKTQNIRDLLARLRFPRLSAREAKFRRDLKLLSPPPSIRIIPPPSFEGDAWRMELSFSNPEELRSATSAAADLASRDGIDRIFAHGPEEPR